MNLSLLIRLSIMMFLQFAVWGAWYSVAPNYFGDELELTGKEIGLIFSLIPLACMISPFIGGQIADRYLPTQIFLAIVHLAGGVFMLAVAPRTDFLAIVILLGVWSLTYAPTLALVNSLSFHHLENTERDFGKIRVWGTLGWVAAGWAVTMWLNVNRPEDMGFLRFLAGPVNVLHSVSSWILGRQPNPETGDIFLIGGYASILMGLFCFLLPNTPPAKKDEKPWAFVEAFKLMKDWHFAVFILISFVVGTELMFYYQLTGPFLEDVGVQKENVAMTMTLAQVAELVTMALLPWFLPRLGLRKSLAIGIIAWPIRYAIFAVGTPQWLMVAALTLHGICYVFFFVVSFIYVDSVAGKEIRASAQALQTFVVLGLGLFVGSYFAGWVKDWFTEGSGGDAVTRWTPVFLIPCVLTVACAVAFLLFFEEPKRQEESRAEPSAAPA